MVMGGRYYFHRGLVEYRNDYCLTCDAARLPYRHRTFDRRPFLLHPSRSAWLLEAVALRAVR